LYKRFRKYFFKMEFGKSYSSSGKNEESDKIYDKKIVTSNIFNSNILRVSYSQSTPNILLDDQLCHLTHTHFQEIFDTYLHADSVGKVLSSFEEMCTKCLNLNREQIFEQGINMKLNSTTNNTLPQTPKTTRLIYKIIKEKTNYWKANELWSMYEKRASHMDYTIQMPCFNRDLHVLIIGCGPVGLRLGIECAFLGVKCTIIEKRDE
jgi:hypothetical protein